MPKMILVELGRVAKIAYQQFGLQWIHLVPLMLHLELQRPHLDLPPSLVLPLSFPVDKVNREIEYKPSSF